MAVRPIGHIVTETKYYHFFAIADTLSAAVVYAVNTNEVSPYRPTLTRVITGSIIYI
jgi:hypothetical protein